jgi:CBS domain-containing protein
MGERLGIFTTTDLRDALLRDVPPSALAVREVARFDLIERGRRRRAVRSAVADGAPPRAPALVRDGDTVVGVLGQLDLVSFVANHSHIVALQIDDATTVAELKAWRPSASTRWSS